MQGVVVSQAMLHVTALYPVIGRAPLLKKDEPVTTSHASTSNGRQTHSGNDGRLPAGRCGTWLPAGPRRPLQWGQPPWLHQACPDPAAAAQRPLAAEALHSRLSLPLGSHHSPVGVPLHVGPCLLEPHPRGPVAAAPPAAMCLPAEGVSLQDGCRVGAAVQRSTGIVLQRWGLQLQG